MTLANLASDIDLGLRRYLLLLQATARELERLRPTSIIALARKGPRLLQLMKEIGVTLPNVLTVADHAIEFLKSEDLGERPVIFDDVTIVGTSLFRLQQRLKSSFNLDSHVVAVIADRENYRPQLVRNYWAATKMSAAETQQFSSELIRAIPLLGLPYDLDHPVFSFNRFEAAQILQALAPKATSIQREHLSLQYEEDFTVLTIHVPTSIAESVAGNMTNILGPTDLFKLKVIDSQLQDEIRFVSVACFPPAYKRWLSQTWKDYKFPANVVSPLAMYRLLCFAGGRILAEAVDERFSSDALLLDQAEVVFSKRGTLAMTKVYESLQIEHQGVARATAVRLEVTPDHLDGLAKSFKSVIQTSNKQANVGGTYDRLCTLWASVYSTVELGFRSELDKALEGHTRPGAIMETVNSKRLENGLTANQLFAAIGATDQLERSIAMDLAVDSGVQVPIYAETELVVARAYHHGESFWDGMRFAALVAKVLDQKRVQIPFVTRINFEKWLIILYDLTCEQNLDMFRSVKHYLENPRISPNSLANIEVTIEFRLHGRTLDFADSLPGLRSAGERRLTSARPAVYWLSDVKHVLVSSESGLTLAKDAATRFLTDIAVPPEVAAPVGMLFQFLAKKLPDEIVIQRGEDFHRFDRDDLLRLLSSCTTEKNYIRAIAEDALLVAHLWDSVASGQDKVPDSFWSTSRSRMPCGEIYQKWRVSFFREDIYQKLKSFFDSNEMDDQFNLFIAPLFASDSTNINRVKNKILDRCLNLFLYVESATSSGNKTSTSNKLKTIDWLKEHGYAIPETKEEQLRYANLLCKEILRRFPTFVQEIYRSDSVVGDEFYIFSDMRDSSAPQELNRAEDAKTDLVLDAKRMSESEDSNRFHFNYDLNDEKVLTINGAANARQSLISIMEKYSSRDKYGRIGIVSNVDTLQSATWRGDLPSAPTNYVLAKRLGEYFKGRTGEVEGILMSDIEKRHADQRHGILGMSTATLSFIELSELFPMVRQFTTLSEFLDAEQEGWVRALSGDIPIERPESPKLGFTIFLYR